MTPVDNLEVRQQPTSTNLGSFKSMLWLHFLAIVVVFQVVSKIHTESGLDHATEPYTLSLDIDTSQIEEKDICR